MFKPGNKAFLRHRQFCLNHRIIPAGLLGHTLDQDTDWRMFRFAQEIHLLDLLIEIACFGIMNRVQEFTPFCNIFFLIELSQLTTDLLRTTTKAEIIRLRGIQHPVPTIGCAARCLLDGFLYITFPCRIGINSRQSIASQHGILVGFTQNLFDCHCGETHGRTTLDFIIDTVTCRNTGGNRCQYLTGLIHQYCIRIQLRETVSS